MRTSSGRELLRSLGASEEEIEHVVWLYWDEALGVKIKQTLEESESRILTAETIREESRRFNPWEFRCVSIKEEFEKIDREVLREWKDSDLSSEEFAESQGLTVSELKRIRRKIRRINAGRCLAALFKKRLVSN